MNLHFNTLKHPLVHAGTQQSERMPAALVEGSLAADDRPMEQLLAFAGILAAHIRYFDNTNTAAGDWQGFWQSDPTSLLAMIAATDLESPRTGYRTAELEYYRRKKKEDEGTAAPGDPPSSAIVDQLVTNTDYGVYGLALLLLRICKLVPATHPLKKEIAALFAGLKDPLDRLIQFHKAIDPEAIKAYAGFIGGDPCAAPWGLPDNKAFECIQWVRPYEFVPEIWKLFLKFYQALMILVQKARKAFHSSLRTRKDHQPHIGLFITFLYLFRYLQADLNGLIEKHLLFYYHDVLRLARKALTPDKAYLYFDIATNLARYRIVKDTEFKAGADSAGKPMFYALMDELVISKATLAEKQNLYLEEKTAGDGSKKVNAIFLPAADKRDGIAEEWPAGTKAWQGLSGMNVFNRQYYKYKQLVTLVGKQRAANLEDRDVQVPSVITKEMEKYRQYLGKLQAFSGFSISSTELWLDKGFTRIIFVEIDFVAGATDPGNLLTLFDLDLITEKGLVTLNAYPLDQELGEVSIANRAAIDELLTQDNVVYHGLGGANPQQYLIFLTDKFPAVLPVDDHTPPFLRFRSKDHFSSGLPGIQQVKVGTLSKGPKPPPAAPGKSPLLLQRVVNGVVQSDVQLVINGLKTNKPTLFLRMPELFFKLPKTLTVLSRQQSAGNIGPIAVSYWDSASPVPADTHTGVVDIANKKEKAGLLEAPAQIDPAAGALQADGWVQLDITLTGAADAAGNVAPFVFAVADLEITYQTQAVTIPVTGPRISQYHYLSYFTSLGDWVAEDDGAGVSPNPFIGEPQLQPTLGAALFPKKAAPAAPAVGGVAPPPPPPVAPVDKNYGNLFLGFDGLVPGQTLSLLFQMADGTGNPDHYAPAITWSYLASDNWTEFPPQYILKDTTFGLGQTGIILFQIPTEINNGNSWIKGKDGRTDLYWLRASADEIPDDEIFIDALPLLVDIFVNAGEVIFENEHNTEDHLEAGLPAGTISAMKFRDVNVKTITQPFASFDGRFSELADTAGYVRRVHERLRHKDRAVTLWDYERLLLQAYPIIYVTKCLTHSLEMFTARPGEVTMAVVPDPGKMTGTRKYYPAFDAGQLAAMKDWLLSRTDYFVSNYGGPEFCCCEEGCQCEPGDRLTVINARFEPVRLKVCVRFVVGKDPIYYSKQLNEDIKAFLCPWSAGNKPLSFGTRITLTSILQFLEGLDYVDVILRLKVKHFATRQVSEQFEDIVCWSSPEEIVPYTAASILTTYLDRLNEDNPNVIDHVIELAEDSDRCHCGTCPECECTSREGAPGQTPPPPPNTDQEKVIEGLRNLLTDMWAQRTSTADVIKLFTGQLNTKVSATGPLYGNIPSAPEKGKKGDAYRIDKIKFANKISQLKVSLSFDTTQPFRTFFVNNPHLE